MRVGACQNLSKERYALKTDSSIVTFPHPDTLDAPLASVLREGARRLLAQAIEAEADTFLAAMADERLADGRARVMRHGHGAERTIQLGTYAEDRCPAKAVR